MAPNASHSEKNRPLNMTVYAILTSVQLLCGCASLLSRTSGGDSEFYDSAIKDPNMAPAVFAPPAADGSYVDNVHLRSQADYHFALAETYSMEGAIEQAIENFKLTLVYDPTSSSVHGRLAREYVRKGLLNEAIRQAELACEYGADQVEPRYYLARLYGGLGMYSAAREQFQKVLDHDPQNLKARLYLGLLLAEQKRNSEALAELYKVTQPVQSEKKKSGSSSKGIKNGPAPGKTGPSPVLEEDEGEDAAANTIQAAYFYIGKIHLENKKLAKASEAFRDSYAIDPSYMPATLGLAQVYQMTQRKDHAIKILEKFQTKYGPDEKVAEPLIYLYMEAKREEDALQQMNIIAAMNPNDINIQMRAAVVLAELKRFNEAVEKLESIIEIAPESDKVRYYLAAIYEEQKKYDRAIDHFSAIPPSSSYYSEARVHTAYLMKLNGKLDSALQSVQEALTQVEDVPQLYTLHAYLLSEKKKNQEAIEVLLKSSQKFPQNSEVIYFLGTMYDKVGNLDESLKSMRRVLAIDNQHVQALNYLAYTLAEHDLELGEAEEFARKADSLKPRDAYILDTLGWVLFKQGKMRESIVLLERAHALNQAEGIIAEHLGDVYLKFELPEKARKMYKKALENNKDAPTTEKLQKKIVTIERRQNIKGDIPDISNRTPSTEMLPSPPQD